MNHRRVLKRSWMLAVIVAALIASHGIVLYRFYSRVSLAILMVLLGVLLLKHIGLFSGIYALFRRGSQRSVGPLPPERD